MPYRQNFPIPSEIDAPLSCLCIPIPDSAEWRAIVAGLLSELTYWFNYERTGDNKGAQCALVWKKIYTTIDWSNMSCCCDPISSLVLYRWDIDSVLEISVDGGVTYNAAPELDPRNNSPTYPPLPGDPSDDKKCLGATSIVTLIREQVSDQLTDDMSRYTLGQLLHDWVTTYIETSNPFEALIQIATNQVLALVIASVRAALTDEVYRLLTCAFFDNIADDLSFNDAQWEQVREDTLSTISGVAGVFLEHLVFLLGKVGITNLARSSAADSGDCTDCVTDAAVYSWDEIASESTQVFPDEDGIYTAHSGVATSGGFYICSIYFHPELPIPAHWNCFDFVLLSNPTGSDPLKYRCGDYTLDALSTCTAQFTFRSAVAPFDIQFSIGSLCGSA